MDTSWHAMPARLDSLVDSRRGCWFGLNAGAEVWEMPGLQRDVLNFGTRYWRLSIRPVVYAAPQLTRVIQAADSTSISTVESCSRSHLEHVTEY